MSNPQTAFDLSAQGIPAMVAYDVVQGANANGLTLDQVNLTNSISEITLETQTSGCAILELVLIDSTWEIQRSGICSTDADNMLLPVDINYPPGSDCWWRLAMVEGTNDFTTPNLTVSFIPRFISYLMNDWGPLAVAPGTNTRAQFVKQLVDRIPAKVNPQSLIGPGSQASNSIVFICPELNVVQPVAQTTASTTVMPAVDYNNQATGVNKAKGLGNGAAITIAGQKPTPTQISNLNTILDAGSAAKASPTVMAAAVYAAIGESGVTIVGSGTGGSQGVFQTGGGSLGSPYSAGQDLKAQATGWFTGGPDFPAGGAIAIAQQNPTYEVWQIANATERNQVWNQSKSDSYINKWGTSAKGEAEVEKIVQAYGVSTSGIISTPAGMSDVSQLTRGTSSNPDEDSWTCIQQLASDVNWAIFTNPSPHPYVYGNYFYYMDYPTIASQKPRCYLSLSDDGTLWSATDALTGKTISDDGIITNLNYTVDNTATQYQSTKSVKGKVMRSTKIRTPQTPTQVQFNMVCGVMQYNAGDVFVIQDAGPINGRWIVEDVTMNTLNDQFAQFTLGPPTAPQPEPQGTTVAQVNNGKGAGGSGKLPTASKDPRLTQPAGTLAAAAEAAQLALADQKQYHCYEYSEASNRDNNGTLFGPAPRTMDCSAFVTLCYKAAGLPDPSDENYSPIGYTGSMIPHFTKISQAQAIPGDVCFFGSSTSNTTHVNIYVGNGQSISMGQQGDPSKGSSPLMGPSGFLGYYHLTALDGNLTSTPKGISLSSTLSNQTPKLTIGTNANGIFTATFDK